MAFVSSSKDIPIDFVSGEEIIISLDIEVHSKANKWERKIIEYHFEPYLEEGAVKCVTV